MSLCALDVGAHECPGALRPFVCAVAPDVTSPHNAGTVLDQRGDEASRLRVVDDGDVTRPNFSADWCDVRRGRPLVDRTLMRAEVTTVAGRAVEAVVNALRHLEERRLPFYDEPLRLDADAERVAEERGQHLGDTASGRRRVDVHDPAVAELAANIRGGLQEDLEALRADHRPETVRVDRSNLGAQRRRQRGEVSRIRLTRNRRESRLRKSRELVRRSHG